MEFSIFDHGVFVVNLLGIILDPATNKILIARRNNDRYINELTWCFPGGRPTYDQDLEEELTLEIKRKTDLDIDVEKIIFAKSYPENRNFISIYYLCRAKNTAVTPSDSFVELKWVSPTEVSQLFTTSIHKKIVEYLKTIQK